MTERCKGLETHSLLLLPSVNTLLYKTQNAAAFFINGYYYLSSTRYYYSLLVHSQIFRILRSGQISAFKSIFNKQPPLTSRTWSKTKAFSSFSRFFLTDHSEENQFFFSKIVQYLQRNSVFFFRVYKMSPSEVVLRAEAKHPVPIRRAAFLVTWSTLICVADSSGC